MKREMPVSLEAKRNATLIKSFLRKNTRSRTDPVGTRATYAGLPCESEVMKLRSVKPKLLLILLCGVLSGATTLPASAQGSPASPPATSAAETPRRQNQFPYGLLGLVGLLGLAGLLRRKRKSDKHRASDDRPPPPPGSYVSDLKTDARTRPE